MKTLFILFASSIVMLLALTAATAQPARHDVPFTRYTQHRWVDSIFNTLTVDEKIAQLIVVAAYSNRGDEHKQDILKVIRDQKIGGLIFFQGGPVRQAKLINTYQAASRVPLLMAIDAEWGLGMRLDSTISYPYQMTLGAIRDDSLLYRMGTEVSRQIRRVGLQVNFAPVVDINSNPDNPVINFRSFGEDKRNVTRKAIAYMQGMQDNAILTTAKHFPGHGDTGTDSHYALPLIKHSKARIDSLELYPFREIIKAGIGGVMIAHLNIPALDSSGLPSTLSRAIVTDLLRNELEFTGLIVTDAMNMKGVTASNPPGMVDRDAIIAGNDMLEFTENVSRAISEIRKAITEGAVSQRDIDNRVKKMLAIKYWTGLHDFENVRVDDLVGELNTPLAKLLNRDLLAAALTVLTNNNAILPIRDLDKGSFASVSFGRKQLTPFQKTLSLYTRINHFTVPNDATQQYVDSVMVMLSKNHHIIAAIHDDPGRPHNRIVLSEPVSNMMSTLASRDNVIVALFKNPYVLGKIPSINQADGLIVAYQDNHDVEELTAQLIFGGISASGRLPVTVGKQFAAGHGLDVRGDIRFKYTLPEDAGINSDKLTRGIDSLVGQALTMKAIPGCQVFVAKDRKVVFHKAYGYHEYSDTIKVKLTDLYDLASVTKISTGLPSLMKLYDEGAFKLEATLGDYLPKFDRSNKGDIPMYDILTHQA